MRAASPQVAWVPCLLTQHLLTEAALFRMLTCTACTLQVLFFLPLRVEDRDSQQGELGRIITLLSSFLLVVSQVDMSYLPPKQVKKGMQGIDCILYEKKGKGEANALSMQCNAQLAVN